MRVLASWHEGNVGFAGPFRSEWLETIERALRLLAGSATLGFER